VVLSGRGGANRSPRSTLVVLTLVSLTILALDTFGFGPIESIQSVVGTVFSPVKAVGDTVFGPVGDVWDATVNRSDLAEENEQLREENADLRSQAATAEQAESLLQQLAEAQNLTLPGDIPRLTAQISSNSVSNFDTDYEIDRGASDGIAPGMPIVVNNLEGSPTLIGVVGEVSLTSARVQLITDPEFKVGVRIATEESADIGVLRGQGPGEPLLVDTGIQARSDVQPEDPVATSGIEDSLFPAFLTIGRVRDTRDAPNPLEQEVLVDPLVELDGLTFVSVLRTDRVDEAETTGSTTATTTAPTG
jgi:rod shape-determining protein MreC